MSVPHVAAPEDQRGPAAFADHPLQPHALPAMGCQHHPGLRVEQARQDDGAARRQMAREVAGLIPGARYEEIADSGHCPMLEQPQALATLIDEFLA